MIEKIVLDYLASKMVTEVYMEVPEQMPEKFITIELTAGISENKVRSSNIAVQSWANSLYDAAELSEAVIAAMDELPFHANVGGCKLIRNYNFTDTDTKKYRYQAVFSITHY